MSRPRHIRRSEARDQLRRQRDAALLLADSLLEAHGQVVMDTEQDRALHSRVMQSFRGLRAAIDGVATPAALESDKSCCTYRDHSYGTADKPLGCACTDASHDGDPGHPFAQDAP